MDTSLRINRILENSSPVLIFVSEERDETLQVVLSFFGEKDVSRSVYNTKQFSVKEADELVSNAKIGAMKQKVFIVSAASLHWVAQNKILKTLEDSLSTTRFIFILEDAGDVLPTILSRAQLFDFSFKKEVDERVKLFLTTKVTMRSELPFLKKLLTLKDKDDKKDREESRRFLRELYKGVCFYNVGSSSELLTLSMLSHSSSAGANFKMIFECLALSIPLVIE